MKTSSMGMALLLGWAALVSPSLQAADLPEPSAAQAPSDSLAQARAILAQGKWKAAVAELQRVNATQSADWNNLMGYALRKQIPPDLDGAQRYYDKALSIDPKHLGALEYAGELDLMKGKLADAELKLARLAQLCQSPCEALDDLKKAIDRYKANGNRHLP